ncbi:TetR family transcriptional regulator [Paenibacillus sp. P96]|uniref:TetR family transcriptional regulator n=1 Tax=Paenibacillus zeirhizosphaerae TaxID=2987519 RepID=A0ABT9FN68_9BACL|nr:TetR family transcriptional regulator [Paenibacillus sp. P96]MDP4096035.1 TetR family transcriptional regulator [Paenibacillus sp. P96]
MTQTEPDIKIRILLAAKRLFAQQGYDGTSCRQVCEAAGANIALISYHFGGKEGVYKAVVEHFFPIKELKSVNFADLDPIEGIRLLVSRIIQVTHRDRELSFIIQQEMLLRSPRRQTVMNVLVEVWSQVRSLLLRGKEEGVFTFDSSTNALVMVMGVALSHKHMVNFEDVFADEKIGVESIAAEAVRFILLGLGVKEA